ncbi:MAG: haloacid dehalogenase [Candidatus Poribacteria bacterium]|nr:MAG: haloacid dehalogenase [Candidatus Poribacteria bacterium]
MSAPKIRAVLFDFDGVIVDTEPLHYRTLAETLAAAGLGLLTEEAYGERYIVFDDREAIRAAFRDAGRPLSPERLEALMEEKARRFRELAAAGVALFPGAREAIEALGAVYPLAIASGALREEIETILVAHGLRSRFLALAAADDVTHSKPHPETYLLALERLNMALRCSPPIRPEETVVIEDTINGVLGAQAAGMRTVAVTHSYPAERLRHAEVVLDSLIGLTPGRLSALLGSSS